TLELCQFFGIAQRRRSAIEYSGKTENRTGTHCHRPCNRPATHLINTNSNALHTEHHNRKYLLRCQSDRISVRCYTLPMSDRPPFVHLRTHSHYSLLQALSKIEELVAQAGTHGMTALALTDYSNLHGSIEFYKECKSHNIKP